MCAGAGIYQWNVVDMPRSNSMSKPLLQLNKIAIIFDSEQIKMWFKCFTASWTVNLIARPVLYNCLWLAFISVASRLVNWITLIDCDNRLNCNCVMSIFQSAITINHDSLQTFSWCSSLFRLRLRVERLQYVKREQVQMDYSLLFILNQ